MGGGRIRGWSTARTAGKSHTQTSRWGACRSHPRSKASGGLVGQPFEPCGRRPPRTRPQPPSHLTASGTSPYSLSPTTPGGAQPYPCRPPASRRRRGSPGRPAPTSSGSPVARPRLRPTSARWCRGRKTASAGVGPTRRQTALERIGRLHPSPKVTAPGCGLPCTRWCPRLRRRRLRYPCKWAARAPWHGSRTLPSAWGCRLDPHTTRAWS
mmetsp:Transcript_125329/g.400632  ORF Transcript_125329/g.400632 Transcript_125329/m.400632 type:complete len:211 (+) Transcript_125329:1660-2292(+)